MGLFSSRKEDSDAAVTPTPRKEDKSVIQVIRSRFVSPLQSLLRNDITLFISLTDDLSTARKARSVKFQGLPSPESHLLPLPSCPARWSATNTLPKVLSRFPVLSLIVQLPLSLSHMWLHQYLLRRPEAADLLHTKQAVPRHRLSPAEPQILSRKDDLS
jgi:hypothetical protein